MHLNAERREPPVATPPADVRSDRRASRRSIVPLLAVLSMLVAALIVIEAPSGVLADRMPARPAAAEARSSGSVSGVGIMPSSTTTGTLDCGLGLPCAGGGSLLLPNTSLRVTSGGPHLRLVQGSAAAAWYPFELQARAFVAAIHQVPNDDRLLAVGRDAVRAVMFAQFLDMIDRQAAGETLTPQESSALAALHGAVHANRVAAREFAIAEYDRWNSDPCQYDPPAGFSFDPYNPICLPITGLSGPPNPPSLEQFQAYGAALAFEPFLDADTMAAADRTELGIAFATTLGLAAASATIIAAIVGSSPVLAATLMAAMGSVTVVKSSFVGAAIFGVGTKVSLAAFGGAALGAAGAIAAASVVLVVVVAAVVTILGAIQLAENLQIRPSLVEARERAADFDLASLAWDSDGEPNEEGTLDLFAAFFLQTTPDHVDERAALAPAPGAWSPGQPRWSLERPDGSVVDREVVMTFNWDMVQEETFIHDGYFVTRTRSGTGLGDEFGPPRLSLTMQYLDDDLNPRMVGLSGGFLIDRSFSDLLDPAPGDDTFQSIAPRLVTIGDEGSTLSVTGNTPPVLQPQIVGELVVGEELTFVSNASDPDGDDITVEWFIEHPDGGTVLNPDSSLCGGSEVPADPLAPRCPWPRSEGEQVTLTYPVSGGYRGFVTVTDSNGATAGQRFDFTVLAGELALSLDDPTPISIDENGSVTISGELAYPGNDRIVLTVDWGDGTRSRRFLPCAFAEFDDDGNLVSDPGCMFVLPGGLRVGGAPSPWDFEFTRTFRHEIGRPLPPDQTIRVWAEVAGGVRSEEFTLPITVSSTPPEVQFVGGYTAADCTSDPLLSIFCVGENRTARTGEAVTVSGHIIDDPSARHLVVIDWGDGGRTVHQPGCRAEIPVDPECPSIVNEPTPSFDVPAHKRSYNFSVQHVYTERGLYDVTVTAYDGDPAGPTVESVRALALNESPTVDDVALTVTPGATHAAPAPGLLAGAVDPDGDPLTVWLLDGPALGSVEVRSDGAWTYTAGDVTGTDTFTFLVSDGFDGAAIGTATIEIGDPEPPAVQFDPSVPTQVDEGTAAAFGFAVTPGTLSDAPVVTADCAGGSVVALSIDDLAAASVTCTWPTGGSIVEPVVGTVIVTATDPDDTVDEGAPLSGVASTDVAILNVPPEITSLTVTSGQEPILVGDEVVVRLSFADPGATTFTARIDWGDGSPLVVLDDVQPDGARVSHRYAAPGTHTVTVTVTDAQGASGVRTTTVSVLGAADAISAAAGAVTGPPGVVGAVTRQLLGDGGRPGAIDMIDDDPIEALARIVAAIAALGSSPQTQLANAPVSELLTRVARGVAVELVAARRAASGCFVASTVDGSPSGRCVPTTRLRLEVATLFNAHGDADADRGRHHLAVVHYRTAVAMAID